LVARAADNYGFRGHFNLRPAVIDDWEAQILQDSIRTYLSVLQTHDTTIQRGFRETALLPSRVSHGPYSHICRPLNLTARYHGNLVLYYSEGDTWLVLIYDLEDLLGRFRCFLVQQVHVDVLITEVPRVEEAEGLVTGQLNLLATQ
jgi:hypothetical protein